MNIQKAQHTPGPWKPSVLRWPNGQLHGAPYVFAPNGPDGGRHVCELYDNGALDANARLIAAAPDLLEALQACMEFWNNRTPIHPSAEVVDQARAAIAKATGEEWQ